MLFLVGCASAGTAQRLTGLMYQSISNDSHPVFYRTVANATATQQAPIAVTSDRAALVAATYRLELQFRLRTVMVAGQFEPPNSAMALQATPFANRCAEFDVELSGTLYDYAGSWLRSWQIIEKNTTSVWVAKNDDCDSTPSQESLERIAAQMLNDLYQRLVNEGVFTV